MWVILFWQPVPLFSELPAFPLVKDIEKAPSHWLHWAPPGLPRASLEENCFPGGGALRLSSPQLTMFCRVFVPAGSPKADSHCLKPLLQFIYFLPHTCLSWIPQEPIRPACLCSQKYGEFLSTGTATNEQTQLMILPLQGNPSGQLWGAFFVTELQMPSVVPLIMYPL